MGNKKKNLLNAVFLIVVFGLTLYGVFRGEDLGEILQIVRKANGIYLFLGIICVIIFILCESVIIFYMMRSLKEKVKLGHCFLYSFVGFFFSCITPSATGGQPAQIYYMKKDKLDIPVSTLVLMIVTITYKLVLVMIGTFVLFFQPGIIKMYFENHLFIFYLGWALNVFCICFMLVLVFHPLLAKGLMMRGLRLLEKLKFLKHKPKRMKTLETSMDQYNATASYYRTHKIVIFNVIIITLFQRILLFFVTFLVYKSFGLTGKSAYDIILLQGMVSVAVDMLPLPGGMGISEKLFLTIFVPIFGVTMLLPAMLLSRGIAYYSQLLISAVMTVVTQFTIGRSSERAREVH